MHVLIVGAGPMACEYSKVLQALQIPFTTIGRSQKSADAYKDTTGQIALTGGYEQYLNSLDTLATPPTHAIIAVGEKRLGEASRAVLNAKIKEVLIEKPGGIDAADIKQVAELAKKMNANVYIGYNRRFYAAVEKTKAILAEDGGLLSFNFEFSEWGHVIADLEKEDGVKENWFLANSSHVIDLAFYVGGTPRHLSAYVRGSLPWHPSAAMYAGAGITKSDALFSYQANWQAPGRWGVEFLTAKHRLYLRPMEKLKIQKLGTIKIEDVEIDDAIDQDFKPGLFRQVESFLGNKTNLPTIDEQVNTLAWYEKMQGNHPR